MKTSTSLFALLLVLACVQAASAAYNITWTLADSPGTAGNDILGLAATSNGQTVYALIENGVGNVYVSGDRGQSYVLLSTVGNSGGSYDKICTSPNGNYLGVLRGSDIWYSNDSGSSWTDTNNSFDPHNTDGAGILDCNAEGNLISQKNAVATDILQFYNGTTKVWTAIPNVAAGSAQPHNVAFGTDGHRIYSPERNFQTLPPKIFWTDDQGTTWSNALWDYDYIVVNNALSIGNNNQYFFADNQENQEFIYSRDGLSTLNIIDLTSADVQPITTAMNNGGELWVGMGYNYTSATSELFYSYDGGQTFSTEVFADSIGGSAVDVFYGGSAASARIFIGTGNPLGFQVPTNPGELYWGKFDIAQAGQNNSVHPPSLGGGGRQVASAPLVTANVVAETPTTPATHERTLWEIIVDFINGVFA